MTHQTTTAKGTARFRERIAIVGMGCLFPKANSPRAYWANINKRVDCITDIPATHWRPDDYYDPDPAKRDHTYAKRGGFISPVAFNPMEYGISPRDIEAIDTTQLLGMVVAKQALEDAGYGSQREFNRKRTSVILGVTGALELVVSLGGRLGFPKWQKALREAGVDDAVAADVVARISDSYVDWQENSFPGLLGNVAAGRIASRLDLGGTNCVVDAACASSLTAIYLAMLELASGKSDMVITGGLDTFNDIFMYMCFSKTPALSATGNSRPFDADGDGTIIGEGLGAVILKRLADAEAAGDRIYAVIRGMGTSSDGKGNAIYAPSVDGQIRALQEAYEVADVNPSTVELVEAHGTGTKVGDSIEVQALTKMFQASDKETCWCALGSVKSQIGHTKAAAGIAGIIKAALGLYHKVLPPTIKVSKPIDFLDTETTPFYINAEARPWLPSPDYPRRAGVSSFGFGGSNFHCVLEEHRPEKPGIDWDGDVQLLAFSAPTVQDLWRRVEEVPFTAPWSDVRIHAHKSRKAFKHNDPCRLTIVVENGVTDLAATLTKVKDKLKSSENVSSWSMPDGVYFNTQTTPGKLGFVMSGQGSQYVGMLRDLACRFPQMNDVLAEANEVFSSLKKRISTLRISDYIYPHPAFAGERKAKNEEALRDTRVAQPAIGAISLGLARVMKHFNIQPDAVSGHSYGELPALCVAGRISERVCHELSNLRAELMAAGADRAGAMLAVQTSIKQVLKTIEDAALKVTIANKNAPEQTVLSGAVEDIRRAAELFSKQKIQNKILNVSSAFHSEWVASAKKPFLEALRKVRFADSDVPVFANTTAEPYPHQAGKAKEVLASQLARPVEFIRQIENMYESGVRTFLELGPGGQITGLVRSILQDKAHAAFSLDGFMERRSAMVSLAFVLAQLASMGYAVQMDRWDGDLHYDSLDKQPAKPALTVAVCGANQFERKQRPSTASTPPRPQQNLVSDTARKGSIAMTAIPPDERRTSQGSAAVGSSRPPPTAQRSITDQGVLAEAFRMTREHMSMLQQYQTQTAELHRQFLEGQEEARKNMERLFERQKNLLTGTSVAEEIIASPSPKAASRPSTPPPPVAAPPASNRVASTSIAASRVSGSTVKSNAVAAMPSSAGEAKPAIATNSGQNDSPIKSALLTVVAEKTGYPQEMLHLDMELDSDLGIDSIKRVEILSAIKEKLPNAPAIGPELFGQIRTLNQILAQLSTGDRRADQPSTVVAAKPTPVLAGPTVDAIATILLQVVADKTGYPQEMLTLEMGLDTDLGIDSIKRVEMLSEIHKRLPTAPEVGADRLGTFRTLGDIVTYLSTNDNGQPLASQPAASVNQTTSAAAYTRHEIQSALLAIVADKTGYPTEMLSLEMGLDTDLGIDSIKRVEILSTIHERLPHAPQPGSDHAGQFRTLSELVDFLMASDQSPAPVQVTDERSVTSTSMDETLTHDHVAKVLLELVAQSTGYPVDMLNLRMGLDSDLGVDSIKRVEILSALQERLPNAPAIGHDQLGAMQTLEQIVQCITGGRSNGTSITTAVASTPIATESTSIANNESAAPLERHLLESVDLNRFMARPKISLADDARIWITDDGANLASAMNRELQRRGYRAEQINLEQASTLQIPDTLDALIVVAPIGGATGATFKHTLNLLRRVGPALRKQGNRGHASFVTISRLDGRFGIAGLNGVGDPISGAFAGFTKTVRHEWPEIHCKAIDVDPAMTEADELASAVVMELLTEGPMEVGIGSQGICGLQLVRAPQPTGRSNFQLNSNDVVVISGGARGVTAEVAVELAQEWRPTLVLLGRTPNPAAEEPWLAPCRTDAEIKSALLRQAKESLTPKELERQYRQAIGNREIVRNLERIRAAGSTVLYRSVDVRDVGALQHMVDEIKREFGPVTGMIHGAGIIVDRRIDDKTAEQFEEVYDTKVTGQLALLAALESEPLKFIVMFSSTTGRFGRIGQVDYAVANEALNKIAQRQAHIRPNCRVISFNWGPWDGGMVSPGLKKVFEQEQIGVIPLRAGAKFLVRELTIDDGVPVEVVVLGPNSKIPVLDRLVEQPASVPMEQAVSFVVNLAEFPCLRSHVIDGQAVLPLAIMMEWLAAGTLHSHPGLQYVGLDNLHINSRLAFPAEQSVTLSLKTSASPIGKNGNYVIRSQICRVVNDEHEIIHAYADVVVGQLNGSPEPVSWPIHADRALTRPELYGNDALFHGPDFHALTSVDGYSANGISGVSRSAPMPVQWMNHPIRPYWLSDPLILDSAFQLVILWSLEQHRTSALPVSLGRYRQYVQRFPTDGARVTVNIRGQQENRIHYDVAFMDKSGAVIAKMDDATSVQTTARKDGSGRKQRLESSTRVGVSA